MNQVTFEMKLSSKSALAAAVIMAMTRLGLVDNNDHARALFRDMMRAEVADLEASRAEFEAQIAKRKT